MGLVGGRIASVVLLGDIPKRPYPRPKGASPRSCGDVAYRTGGVGSEPFFLKRTTPSSSARILGSRRLGHKLGGLQNVQPLISILLV